MSTLLRLYTPEINETLEIIVSDEDAQRAETDLEFATQLLAQAQVRHAVSPTASSTESSVLINEERVEESADDATDASESEAVNGFISGFKWPHEAILLLVEEFRKEQRNLASGKISQKRVWERIAQVLESKGHRVTGPQCLSKFNGLKRTFKSIKDHNGKSGNNTRAWPYLDLMDSVLGENPFMQPVATLSSTGTVIGLASSQASLSPASTSRSTSLSEETPSPSRKRKGPSDIAEAILESRRMAEESRERRHRERMEEKTAFQGKMLIMLGNLIDKI